jgi:hypothetical protein
MSQGLAEARGQGVHCEVESEGFEEKYQAVINGSDSDDEPSAKDGQGRACTMEAKAFQSTRRTKVFAGGMVQKEAA